MSKKNKHVAAAPKTEADAEKIAKRIQKPGQRKEQTRLIAQGIKKGMDIYKAEQNAKIRALDKSRKQVLKQRAREGDAKADIEPVEECKPQRLPWILLGLSWVGFGLYLALV